MVDSTGRTVRKSLIQSPSKSPGANILAVEMRQDHSANIRRASKLAQHPEGWFTYTSYDKLSYLSFWMYLESHNADWSRLFRPSSGLSCQFVVFTCSHVLGAAFILGKSALMHVKVDGVHIKCIKMY